MKKHNTQLSNQEYERIRDCAPVVGMNWNQKCNRCGNILPEDTDKCDRCGSYDIVDTPTSK